MNLNSWPLEMEIIVFLNYYRYRISAKRGITCARARAHFRTRFRKLSCVILKEKKTHLSLSLCLPKDQVDRARTFARINTRQLIPRDAANRSRRHHRLKTAKKHACTRVVTRAFSPRA